MNVIKVKFKRNRRFLYITLVLCFLFLLVSTVSIYHYVKDVPENISFEGDIHYVNDVTFLTDLTYTKDDDLFHEQTIFSNVHTIIEEAETFLLLDMFLFNDEYDRAYTFPTLSAQLVDALVQKRKDSPHMPIVVITDEINTFYGSYPAQMEKTFKENNITLIYTNMKPLRDSNPVYSAIYRTFFQWFGTSGTGWLPNPFSPNSPNVTARSFLQLLNFKANHRKIALSEKEAVVTSANPHDSSAHHSNIGFLLHGPILKDILTTELAVIQMSGGDEKIITELLEAAETIETTENEETYAVQLLTEGKIKKRLLQQINETNEGDRITIGAFYISDRQLIHSLLEAARRDVHIQLILDPNKDAFGREKNGVPNRPVAHELRKKSNEQIQIRWYDTNGEQYHSKFALIDKAKESVVIGGSANFTKRNIGNFNLETDVLISADRDTPFIQDVRNYVHTIWDNEEATFTVHYDEYKNESVLLTMLYRFQEWSGLSTF